LSFTIYADEREADDGPDYAKIISSTLHSLCFFAITLPNAKKRCKSSDQNDFQHHVDPNYWHVDPQSLWIWDGKLQAVKKIPDLPTPCLLLDLDGFQANVEQMSRFAGDRGVALRPHAKTHKCVNIARRQIEKGAVGISVATIAEAEVMARAEIRGLLLTAEMVGEPKIARLMQLARKAPDTMVVVDHADNARDLEQAAAAAQLQLHVLIDLDIGQNRTGVEPGVPALKLAQTIANLPNLRLKGLCAYAGHVAHTVGFAERRAGSQRALQRAIATRDLLVKNGHEVEILTGASTGTYNIDADITGLTELQSGSYVFMDVEYRRIGGKGGTLYDDFVPALSVLATVIHRSGNKAIVDAGLKAFATDRPFGPEPVDGTLGRYEFAGDEHGRLLVEKDIKLGEKVRFITPHCDPTVNLYDRIHCVRGDVVEDVWPIMERGSGGPYF
jgi:D-serine deaminase-like pyridoxal phosphate-dependent protein